MSAYEELVERCVLKGMRARRSGRDEWEICHAHLAEVFRTLQDVTPEMQEAHRVASWSAPDTWREGAAHDWAAMLRASPLAPPEQK